MVNEAYLDETRDPIGEIQKHRVAGGRGQSKKDNRSQKKISRKIKMRGGSKARKQSFTRGNMTLQEKVKSIRVVPKNKAVRFSNICRKVRSGSKSRSRKKKIRSKIVPAVQKEMNLGEYKRALADRKSGKSKRYGPEGKQGQTSQHQIQIGRNHQKYDLEKHGFANRQEMGYLRGFEVEGLEPMEGEIARERMRIKKRESEVVRYRTYNPTHVGFGGEGLGSEAYETVYLNERDYAEEYGQESNFAGERKHEHDMMSVQKRKKDNRKQVHTEQRKRVRNQNRKSRDLDFLRSGEKQNIGHSKNKHSNAKYHHMIPEYIPESQIVRNLKKKYLPNEKMKAKTNPIYKNNNFKQNFAKNGRTDGPSRIRLKASGRDIETRGKSKSKGRKSRNTSKRKKKTGKRHIQADRQTSEKKPRRKSRNRIVATRVKGRPSRETIEGATGGLADRKKALGNQIQRGGKSGARRGHPSGKKRVPSSHCERNIQIKPPTKHRKRASQIVYSLRAKHLRAQNPKPVKPSRKNSNSRNKSVKKKIQARARSRPKNSSDLSRTQKNYLSTYETHQKRKNINKGNVPNDLGRVVDRLKELAVERAFEEDRGVNLYDGRGGWKGLSTQDGEKQLARVPKVCIQSEDDRETEERAESGEDQTQFRESFVSRRFESQNAANLYESKRPRIKTPHHHTNLAAIHQEAQSSLGDIPFPKPDFRKPRKQNLISQRYSKSNRPSQGKQQHQQIQENIERQLHNPQYVNIRNNIEREGGMEGLDDKERGTDSTVKNKNKSRKNRKETRNFEYGDIYRPEGEGPRSTKHRDANGPEGEKVMGDGLNLYAKQFSQGFLHTSNNASDNSTNMENRVRILKEGNEGTLSESPKQNLNHSEPATDNRLKTDSQKINQKRISKRLRQKWFEGEEKNISRESLDKYMRVWRELKRSQGPRVKKVAPNLDNLKSSERDLQNLLYKKPDTEKDSLMTDLEPSSELIISDDSNFYRSSKKGSSDLEQLLAFKKSIYSSSKKQRKRKQKLRQPALRKDLSKVFYKQLNRVQYESLKVDKLTKMQLRKRCQLIKELKGSEAVLRDARNATQIRELEVFFAGNLMGRIWGALGRVKTNGAFAFTVLAERARNAIDKQSCSGAKRPAHKKGSMEIKIRRSDFDKRSNTRVERGEDCGISNLSKQLKSHNTGKAETPKVNSENRSSNLVSETVSGSKRQESERDIKEKANSGMKHRHTDEGVKESSREKEKIGWRNERLKQVMGDRQERVSWEEVMGLLDGVSNFENIQTVKDAIRQKLSRSKRETESKPSRQITVSIPKNAKPKSAKTEAIQNEKRGKTKEAVLIKNNRSHTSKNLSNEKKVNQSKTQTIVEEPNKQTENEYETRREEHQREIDQIFKDKLGSGRELKRGNSKKRNQWISANKISVQKSTPLKEIEQFEKVSDNISNIEKTREPKLGGEPRRLFNKIGGDEKGKRAEMGKEQDRMTDQPPLANLEMTSKIIESKLSWGMEPFITSIASRDKINAGKPTKSIKHDAINQFPDLCTSQSKPSNMGTNFGEDQDFLKLWSERAQNMELNLNMNASLVGEVVSPLTQISARIRDAISPAGHNIYQLKNAGDSVCSPLPCLFMTNRSITGTERLRRQDEEKGLFQRKDNRAEHEHLTGIFGRKHGLDNQSSRAKNILKIEADLSQKGDSEMERQSRKLENKDIRKIRARPKNLSFVSERNSYRQKHRQEKFPKLLRRICPDSKTDSFFTCFESKMNLSRLQKSYLTHKDLDDRVRRRGKSSQPEHKSQIFMLEARSQLSVAIEENPRPKTKKTKDPMDKFRVERNPAPKMGEILNKNTSEDKAPESLIRSKQREAISVNGANPKICEEERESITTSQRIAMIEEALKQDDPSTLVFREMVKRMNQRGPELVKVNDFPVPQPLVEFRVQKVGGGNVTERRLLVNSCLDVQEEMLNAGDMRNKVGVNMLNREDTEEREEIKQIEEIEEKETMRPEIELQGQSRDIGIAQGHHEKQRIRADFIADAKSEATQERILEREPAAKSQINAVSQNLKTETENMADRKSFETRNKENQIFDKSSEKLDSDVVQSSKFHNPEKTKVSNIWVQSIPQTPEKRVETSHIMESRTTCMERDSLKKGMKRSKGSSRLHIQMSQREFEELDSYREDSNDFCGFHSLKVSGNKKLTNFERKITSPEGKGENTKNQKKLLLDGEILGGKIRVQKFQIQDPVAGKIGSSQDGAKERDKMSINREVLDELKNPRRDLLVNSKSRLNSRTKSHSQFNRVSHPYSRKFRLNHRSDSKPEKRSSEALEFEGSSKKSEREQVEEICLKNLSDFQSMSDSNPMNQSEAEIERTLSSIRELKKETSEMGLWGESGISASGETGRETQEKLAKGSSLFMKLSEDGRKVETLSERGEIREVKSKKQISGPSQAIILIKELTKPRPTESCNTLSRSNPEPLLEHKKNWLKVKNPKKVFSARRIPDIAKDKTQSQKVLDSSNSFNHETLFEHFKFLNIQRRAMNGEFQTEEDLQNVDLSLSFDRKMIAIEKRVEAEMKSERVRERRVDEIVEMVVSQISRDVAKDVDWQQMLLGNSSDFHRY